MGITFQTVSAIELLLITPWFWQIISQHRWLAILILLSTISLTLARGSPRKIPTFIFIISLTSLLAWQLISVPHTPLTYLDNDQQRVQQLRLRAYPPISIQILNKRYYLPLAHWLEARPETTTFYRLRDNFSQLIDPSTYFFAGHPRERIGDIETEKFTFIWMPFFIIGCLLWLRKPRPLFWLTIVLGVLGSLTWRSAVQQPVVLLPFITVIIIEGIQQCLNLIKPHVNKL